MYCLLWIHFPSIGGFEKAYIWWHSQVILALVLIEVFSALLSSMIIACCKEQFFLFRFFFLNWSYSIQIEYLRPLKPKLTAKKKKFWNNLDAILVPQHNAVSFSSMVRKHESLLLTVHTYWAIFLSLSHQNIIFTGFSWPVLGGKPSLKRHLCKWPFVLQGNRLSTSIGR